MIKGCNIFGGQKLANTCSSVGGRIIVQQKKISRAECSWTNPLNVLQKAIHFSFIKFCMYCFFFWYEFFVHYTLRIKKIINMVLMRDLWNLFLWPRGCLTNPFRTLSLCFGVIDKTPGLTSSNNFVKKNFVCTAITITSWQDVTRSSLCSYVKECRTKCAHNFLFPGSSFRIQRTTILGMFKGSAIVINAIRRSATAECLPQFESILISDLSHLLPAPFPLEIENTT